MARRGGSPDTLLTLALVGGIGYGLWSLADANQLGPDAKKLIEDLKQGRSPGSNHPATHDAQGGTAATDKGGGSWRDLHGLCDLGGFCALQANAGSNRIRQMPDLGGTNSYAVGAVFDDSGEKLRYLGGMDFVSLDTGEQFTWGQRGK